MKKLNTKESIVKKGIELFKKDGFENVTVPLICREAKVSKGTFYYYFQSKNEIIYEYIESFLADSNDIMAEVLSLNGAKEQLWCLYQYVCEQTIAMGAEVLYAFFRADMSEGLKQLSPSNGTTYQYHSKAFIKLFLNLIQKAQNQGEISPAPAAEDLLLTFNTIIVGTGLEWSSQHGRYDEIERLRKLFEIVFRE